MDEHNEEDWHVTDEGDLYCLECWRELTKPQPEVWEQDAVAFLAQTLDQHLFSVFGPFVEQRVIHVPTGRVWEPEYQEVPIAQNAVVDLDTRQQTPQRVA